MDKAQLQVGNANGDVSRMTRCAGDEVSHKTETPDNRSINQGFCDQERKTDTSLAAQDLAVSSQNSNVSNQNQSVSYQSQTLANGHLSQSSSILKHNSLSSNAYEETSHFREHSHHKDKLTLYFISKKFPMDRDSGCSSAQLHHHTNSHGGMQGKHNDELSGYQSSCSHKMNGSTQHNSQKEELITHSPTENVPVIVETSDLCSPIEDTSHNDAHSDKETVAPHDSHAREPYTSPDTQSTDTFFSAASHLSGDEMDNVDDLIHAEIVHGVNAQTPDEGEDQVEGLCNLTPKNESSNSSTLSPGSAGAPGVAVIPPSSSSSSSKSAQRPSHLGTIPKFKMDSLSPSYRPMDKHTVIEEAMRVLDSYLKRSFSQNDVSPLLHEYQAVMEMERIEEDTDPEQVRRMGVARGKLTTQDSLPDYEDSLSPVCSSASGSLSSSFKHKIVPLTKKDVDDAFEKKEARKKQLVKRRKPSTTSSSTTTDEETAEQRKARRKRKSLFKKAKERLRQSFKQRREAEGKKSSDRSSTQSPVAEVLGEIHTNTKTHIHTEVHQDPAQKGDGIILQTETTRITKDEKYSKKSGKHTETTIKKKESFPIKDKTENKNLFETVWQYLRSGKAKLKKSGSAKKHPKKSQSVEDLQGLAKHRGLVEQQDDHRTITHQTITQIGGSAGDADVDYADGRRTRPIHLDLHPFRPAMDLDLERDERQLVIGGAQGRQVLPLEVHESRHVQPCQGAEGGHDDVDFNLFGTTKQLAEKPHFERSNSEREHIYEKVADQLAAIADNYDFTSPLSPDKKKSPIKDKVSDEPVVKPGKPPDPEQQKEAEMKLASYLREKGDKITKQMPELNPIVRDLVRNVSYSHFQNVLHQQMSSENNWQQVALMFQVIKQAVHAVGYGTAMAMQLKEMSLRYFEDRFADWVIGQGGWESMVEETDLSSEVD